MVELCQVRIRLVTVLKLPCSQALNETDEGMVSIESPLDLLVALDTFRLSALVRIASRLDSKRLTRNKRLVSIDKSVAGEQLHSDGQARAQRTRRSTGTSFIHVTQCTWTSLNADVTLLCSVCSCPI
ncbi:hypothetical protein ElyMa_005124700 [Elysia marginata]|uniref:Uncharacterized protein n=1 Tax=Elysia marginata TaxID=1093978 RepID=A0AAV4JMC5_9GAST|nr:hypothetical protein ElyMa_005124700 [Elysia marginata]